jgi:hypothetical protein
MASEDYVLYAVLALIIVGIIALVIYKTKKQSDSFAMTNSSKEEYIKAIKASKQPVKKETYTNITACPCSDTDSGCPMGCSCGKCGGEKFQHEAEPVVYTSINATGGGSSIKKDTRANSDPFRGDITITSPPSGHQTTQASFETSAGGKNIVFGA